MIAGNGTTGGEWFSTPLMYERSRDFIQSCGDGRFGRRTSTTQPWTSAKVLRTWPSSNPDYVRPVWPAARGSQRMMTHLDFEVTDLEAETARAVSLGAVLAEYQPQENVRVLLDPAGHPFCLYT